MMNATPAFQVLAISQFLEGEVSALFTPEPLWLAHDHHAQSKCSKSIDD